MGRFVPDSRKDQQHEEKAITIHFEKKEPGGYRQTQDDTRLESESN